jgi:hypothetical protein
MRSKWYAVAYGNKVEMTKANTPQEAARICFGLEDAMKMTVVILSKNPTKMSKKQREEELNDLASRHRKKTGNMII